MGRHKKYETKEEQSYARKLRNKRYYEQYKDRLNAESMRKYWERKEMDKKSRVYILKR